MKGFNMLKNMEKKGNNQFVWGCGKDNLKTMNSDILRKADPPIPISSMLWGLLKDIVKDSEKNLRVKWSIIEQILSFDHVHAQFVTLSGKQFLTFHSSWCSTRVNPWTAGVFNLY